ncbi:MAG: FAD-dependent oxidoreductase [Clostridium sp.]|uniref:FAD-dependent oxidoreductase n=1 Tax=Clostridium sp. TaxID=1506 RepID=UPI003052DAB3
MGRDLKGIEKLIRRTLQNEIHCSEWHNSIVLDGQVNNWSEVVTAGKLARNKGYKGVVNRIKVNGLDIPDASKPVIEDGSLEGKKIDVLVIGGGIIGTSIARELTKWNISILLVEKEEDLCMHASSRNDGMIHPGIEPRPGSKKSIFNVRGNSMYEKISKELDVEFSRCGSTVILNNRWARLGKPFIMARARKAGVKGVTLLSKEEVGKLEPNLRDVGFGAVHFDTTGIISPYKLTVAYGENAVENGAEFYFNTMVTAIEREKDEILSVKTNRGKIYPKVVINAAGVFSDHIANMAGDQFFSIHPRKGQIIILDKKKYSLLNGVVAKPILNSASKNTKGGGIVKTIDGNLLVGPDAYEQPFREDYSTDKDKIDSILSRHLPLVSKLSYADVITYFSGIRAATYEEDFIIEQSEYVKNLIHVAGIQSPGLASAPAIAAEVENIVCKVLSSLMEMKRNPHWNPNRIGIPNLSNMSLGERSKFIKSRTDYGTIICRCEEISKGEIIDAIHSPIPARTIDGIKRRIRPGMGRCQGGFCMPLIMKIIEEETEAKLSDVTKKGKNSNIIVGEIQEIYKDKSDESKDLNKHNYNGGNGGEECEGV